MEILLSGSIGPEKNNKHYEYDTFVGALVRVKSQRSLGYIIRAIDVGFKVNICRFTIWMSRSKDRFGTYLDDVDILQLLTGSK